MHRFHLSAGLAPSLLPMVPATAQGTSPSPRDIVVDAGFSTTVRANAGIGYPDNEPNFPIRLNADNQLTRRFAGTPTGAPSTPAMVDRILLPLTSVGGLQVMLG